MKRKKWYPDEIDLFFFVLFFWKIYIGIDIVTEYYRMPPLYELDDYDRCMMGQAHPEKEGIYCYTKALIQPNSSVEIWNIINVSQVIILRL